MKRFSILILAAAAGAFAQTASFPAAVATDATLFKAANNLSTALAAQQLSTDTTLVVVSTVGFQPNMLVSVGAGTSPEIEAVCAVGGGSLTIGYNGACPSISGRNFNGTTRTSHPVAAPVAVNLVAWHLDAHRVEIEAIEQSLFGTVSAANYGAVGDGTADDTAAIQAALTAVQGTTTTLMLTRTYRVNGCPTATAAIHVAGGGKILVSPGAGIAGCGLQVVGGGFGVQHTTTTNLPFNQRSLSTTNTLSVDSTSGLSVGAIVDLSYDDGTYHFEQPNPILSISGSTITFVDPIVAPVVTSQTNNVSLLNMVSGSTISDLTFDCSGAATGATQVYGLELFYASSSRVDSINYLNCSSAGTDNAGALWAFEGWRNQFTSQMSYGSGSLNSNAINLAQQSHVYAANLRADAGPPQTGLGAGHGAFGIGFNYMMLSSVFGCYASGNYSREVKMQGSGWNSIHGCVGNNSARATGFAVVIGSYRNNFFGIEASNNNSDVTNGNGIWLNGQDNEYNTFYGAIALSNGTADISWSATDAHNLWYGTTANSLPSGTAPSQTDPGTGNRVDFLGEQQFAGSVGCSGTATSSVILVLNQTPSGACTNTTVTPGAYFTAPTGGTIRNLRVTAATGGVNSSSGLVNIVIVGLGVSVVTATLGTATSASDTTHSYRLTAGQQFYVAITNQAAETLAGVNVSFEY